MCVGDDGVGKQGTDTDARAGRLVAERVALPLRANSAGFVMTACPCVKKDSETVSGLRGEEC